MNEQNGYRRHYVYIKYKICRYTIKNQNTCFVLIKKNIYIIYYYIPIY